MTHRRRGAAAAFALIASTPVSAAAQSANLADLVRAGETVWITTAAGREDRTRVVEVTPDHLIVGDASGTRMLRVPDISRVRVRRSDPIWEGALIGAGTAIGAGLFLCRATEPWDVCDDPGPILRIGLVGAGIGAGVDALVRGRRTVYEAGAPRVSTGVLLGADAAGVRVAIAF